jgi:rubrerythrin
MSTRNNEDRVGARQVADAPPPLEENEQNTTSLSFATPTEIVDLPSKGKYYQEGHPLHGMETVEIKFMTAKDEDILSSRTLIRKGIVIDRLLSNVMIDKRVNPDDLLLGDKNALIVATRITGYGEEYNTNINCPVCGLASEYSFDLENVDINNGGALNVENVSETENNTFKFTLPKTKVEVEIRLLCGHDEKRLQHIAEKHKQYGLGEATLTDQLRMMIMSVNGVEDAATKNSFVENMPAMDSKYLRGVLKKITPNLDMTQIFSCESCGHTGAMEVPLTADFFWPRQ